jgi:octaprenyl-diphosphate synthase
MKAHLTPIEPIAKTVDWHSVVADELVEVEKYLASAIGSSVPTVYEVSKHLLSAGGKRLRPGLVALSACAATASPSKKRIAGIGAVVELIHMATLVHDDVVDQSGSRRGRPTANVFWGNKISVLSGDFMLAKAFRLLSNDGDHRIMRAISDMTILMSESEALQAMCEHDVEAWRQNYWHIIKHKTAGFLSSCCRCGAIISDASPDAEESLAGFGMELGMAFQLTDDVLDLVGEPHITGKPVGNDVREGKATFPVLLALDAMAEEDRESARGIIENPSATDDEIVSLCDCIRSTGVVEAAREKARDFAEQAIARLENLPESPARDALSSLATDVICRIR